LVARPLAEPPPLSMRPARHARRAPGALPQLPTSLSDGEKARRRDEERSSASHLAGGRSLPVLRRRADPLICQVPAAPSQDHAERNPDVEADREVAFYNRGIDEPPAQGGNG